jgi:hypothetical protein
VAHQQRFRTTSNGSYETDADDYLCSSEKFSDFQQNSPETHNSPNFGFEIFEKKLREICKKL